MKKWLGGLSVFLTVFFVTGCPDPAKGDDDKNVLARRKFWAINMNTDQSYQIDAELLESRTNCEIWVEKGAKVSMAQVKQTADAYYGVYNSVYNNFGWLGSLRGSTIDQVAYANYLANGNPSKKLTILLLDINKTNSLNNAYVAGYFWPGDILSNLNSNQCAMIYMDAYAQTPGGKGFNATVAHELQHLFNFISTIQFRSVVNENVLQNIYPMDTWINEGLSEATYRLYTGEHDQGRLNWYSAENSSTNL